MTNQISISTIGTTGEPIAELHGTFTISDVVKVLRQLADKAGNPEAIIAGQIDLMPLVSSSTGMPMVEMQSPALDKPIQFTHREQAAGMLVAFREYRDEMLRPLEGKDQG